MPNSNLNVKFFPFFDSVKNPITTDGTSESCNNNGYDRLTLEVTGTGTGTISVEGCVNFLDAAGNEKQDSDCTFTAIQVLDLSDYEMKSSIASVGIYQVDIAGLSKIHIKAENVTGTGLTIVGALSKRN